MKPRFPTISAVFLCLLLVGTTLTLWGCDGQPAAEKGTGLSAPATNESAPPADGLTDRAAADIVRRYFTTTAVDRMQGVAIEGLQVTSQMGQRTLRLDLVSDGSDEADGSLAWLCFGATSEEGWTGDLNDDRGLGLFWVHIYTTYPWGDVEHSVVDIAGRSLTTYGGAPHWRGGPATTVSSVPGTSTTLAPGVMTFDTCTDRFETLIRREDLPGTLPYSLMEAEEVAWLSAAVPQVTFTETRGYRFANGDLVVLFSCDPPLENSSSAPQQALAGAAKERYTRNDEEVWVFIDGGFGYLVVSKQYRSELGTLAQWARWGHQQLIDGE